MTDLDFEGWVCPTPLRETPNIVMGHGGGGAMSAELVEQLFLPAFGSAAHAELGDSAVLPRPAGRLAFSTDSFVVKPMFFPGGSIGDLAVNGTVNDLAMSGATPLFLSTAFVLAEGTPLEDLGRVATALGKAAEAAGVALVTGDTKVVDAGSGDGVFVNTAGIGLVPDGVDLGPRRAAVGDVGPGQRRHRRARHRGDELPGGPGVRHHHRERHRAPSTGWWPTCSPPGPTCMRCATRPAAGCRPRSTRSRGRGRRRGAGGA